MKSPKFTLERLRAVLDYDPQSGRLNWALPGSNNRGAFSVPGYVAANKRRYINIDGDVHMAHRLVWWHHTGEWPDKNVVAGNGDYLDLRIDNLRVESVAETAARKSVTSKCSSGVKGVNWDRRKKKWQVTITRDYAQKHFGHYDDLEEARAVYERAMAEYKPDVSPEQRAAKAVAASARAKIRRHWKHVQKAFSNHTWESLDAFAADVGVPTDRGLMLAPTDPSAPIGPHNFHWRTAARFDTRTPEGVKALQEHKSSSRVMYYREKDLQKKFGLGLAEFEAMSAAQGHVCGICGAEENQYRDGVVRNFAVDHCHTTGKVRGLLCEQCNKGLGFFRDDEAIIEKAITYLRKHRGN